VAEVNVSDTSDAPRANGVARADARPHARWPRWKIVVAYAVFFAVAVGAIWMIDDHVLKATPRVSPTTVPITPGSER
jgi:hypothetical protein